MKRLASIGALLLLLAPNAPQSAPATEQVSDGIRLDDAECYVLECPLERFWKDGSQRPEFDVLSTANRKGYAAGWEVRESKLWLVSFEGKLDGRPVAIDRLFPGRKLPIPAMWYTAELYIPIENPSREPGSRDWRYERLVILDVAKGVVIQRTERRHAWPERWWVRDRRKQQVARRRAGTIIMVHRGASRMAPENTLEAYAAAMDLGADGCEIDVRRTRDGTLVLFHDDQVDRMLEAVGPLRDFTYDQLQEIPFRNTQGEARRQIRVPALSSFLLLARDRAMLIRLDVKEPGCQDEVLRMIDQADMWDHLVEVNAGNAERIRGHPNVRLKRYKGWFPQSDPPPSREAIERFLRQPGEMVFLEHDPTPAVEFFGRETPTEGGMAAWLYRRSWFVLRAEK